MKKIKMGCFFCLVVTLFSTLSYADTITGELTFMKKASFAGVVYMEAIEGYEAPLIVGASVDQLDKKFTKKIVVGGKGGAVSFRNSDAIDHNIYSNDSLSGVKFDVGLMVPAGKKVIDVTWKEKLLVRYGCKIHPKMKSYIFTTPTSFYQVLEFEKKVKSYTFILENVPGELTEVSLMIPKYDVATLKLAEGESKEIIVLRKGKKKAILTVSRVK